MNNEDMSEIMQKITSMINNSNSESANSDNQDNNSSDVSSNSNNFNEDAFKNILSNLNTPSSNDSENNESNFNFDINTMLKIKNVMDKMNSTKNDPRSNLLRSLKPYLNNDRKQKLDQYMQFLNISKIIESFNSDGGGNNK